MSRRRYTDADRASGLAALDANGGDLNLTAKQTGVPRNTIRNWRDGVAEVLTELRQEKKADLAERLEQIAYELTNAIPGKIDTANLQQVATSLGIAVDKMRLLKGEATSIEEVRDDSAAKHELAERLKRLRAASVPN